MLDALPLAFSVGGFNFIRSEFDSKRRLKNDDRFVETDLLLTGYASQSVYETALSPGFMRINFGFVDKSLQQSILQRAVGALKLKHYYQPFFSGNFDYVTFDKSKRYLVKPERFANGEMQFLYDPQTLNPLVLERYLDNKDFKGLQELGIKLSTGAYANTLTTEGTSGQIESMITDLGAKGSGDFMVCELVENVVAEYRVITDHIGEPIIAVKREIVSTNAGFNQATGVTGGVPVVAREEAFEKAIPHGKEIRRLIRSMQAPLCGWDIFITADKKFGVFEFGPGWGTSNVPHDVVMQETYSFLTSCAQQAKNYTANY